MRAALPETPETRPANDVRFPALDGIRAFAFLLVFADHCLLLPWGWGGLDLFFVLSGFLITGILLDTRFDRHRARNFYIRRALRILPLYYGVIAVVALTLPIFLWQRNWTLLLWPTFLGNFAPYLRPSAWGSEFQRLAFGQLTSRNHPHLLLYFGHFWSLCVEEQFYLFWPCVVFWISDRRKLFWLCVLAVVACPFLRVASSHELPAYMVQYQVLYRATPLRIDALLLGGLIALVRRSSASRAMMRGARVLVAVLCSILAIWLLVTPAARHGAIGYAYPEWAFTWGLVFIDLLSACLIVLALDPGTWTFRIFNVRVLRWLGQISYGMYVFHDIFHDVIGGRLTRVFGQARVPTAIVLLVFTIALAYTSYRWFEYPFIRMKDRWTRN